MSKWHDPEVWDKLCSGETCVICRRGQPQDIAATLETSWLTINENAPLRGYCCLVFQRHAVELHDLSEPEGAAYMRDIQKVSRAIKDATGAVKMNCELHGNSLPHLHTHFYPRHPGDPFDGSPIDWNRIKEPVYAEGEFADYVQRVQAALAGATE